MKSRVVITELFARRETCQRRLGPFHFHQRIEVYHAAVLEVVCDGGEPTSITRGRITTPSVPEVKAHAYPWKRKEIAV